MSRKKTYNSREASKILRVNDYEYEGCKGDHFRFRHREKGNLIVITKKLNKMVWQRICKENNIAC